MTSTANIGSVRRDCKGQALRVLNEIFCHCFNAKRRKYLIQKP